MKFYESDEVNRTCLGKKECMRVRDCDGMISMVKKRLVLENLNSTKLIMKRIQAYDFQHLLN